MESPNETLLRIEGTGSVEVEIRGCHDTVRSHTFFNVLFVPTYCVNLMGVRSAVAIASRFSFAVEALHLLPPDGRQLHVKQSG